MKHFLLSRLRCFLVADSDGSALVEMAVILPMMMLLITGTCSLGVVLNNYLVLTNATQNGAMQMAVSAGQTGLDPCQLAASNIAATSPALNAANITYTFYFSGAPSGQTQVGPFTGTTASTCTGDAQYMTADSTVSVTTNYPVQLMIFGWSPVNMTLQTTTAELAQ
jgi:Flp pilus assembly protein TadG